MGRECLKGVRHGDAPAEVHVLRGVTAIGLGFSNLGDEVLLLNAAGAAIDVVTYRDGDYPGVIPHPGVTDQGRSLEQGLRGSTPTTAARTSSSATH